MAKQPRILVGQIAAVTGGARGIGRETARALLREGMKVAIGDLDLELARTTATELGPNAAAFELDVTRRDSFERFVDEAEQQLGPVDVLVNNAGIMALGRFLDEDDATAQRMIDINLHGVIWGMKVVLPRMIAALYTLPADAPPAGTSLPLKDRRAKKVHCCAMPPR